MTTPISPTHDAVRIAAWERYSQARELRDYAHKVALGKARFASPGELQAWQIADQVASEALEFIYKNSLWVDAQS